MSKLIHFMSNPHDILEIEKSKKNNKDIFSEILEKKLSRRAAIKSIAIAGITGVTASQSFSTRLMANSSLSTLTFNEIPHGVSDTHLISKGYTVKPIIRWGDHLDKDEAFSISKLDQEWQDRAMGYNADYIGYYPLPKGSQNSDHGILVINNEYNLAHLMFPGVKYTREDRNAIPKEINYTELSSIGLTIVEVKKVDGEWQYIKSSQYNRRLNAHTTDFYISGPATGHDRMKTELDPTGEIVAGTMANCSGGMTPWGTVVSGEENFHGNFLGKYADDNSEAENGKRYGFQGWSYTNWGLNFDRFNVEKTPNEPNRFGWVVEFDPYDPQSTPKKRTALGRFSHEGVGFIENKDGRVVGYMGDDKRFEYIYRYVSNGRVDHANPSNNDQLLDDGILSVAEFKDNGRLIWHPLVYGTGPLTEDNRFYSQADVLIETRRAADLVGATPMDRPESVVPNPVNGKIYAMLTKNKMRKAENVNMANHRIKNIYGQIIELTPPDNDHTSDIYEWDLFIECGNPNDIKHQARYHEGISPNGWFFNPDNATFDQKGRLWIATDSNLKAGICDGLYACDTEGDSAGLTKQFFRAPIGAEVTGPCFTPDNKTIFLSVQHPGDNIGSDFDNPSTRWPDFKDDMPPRPTVIAITKNDQGIIGS